MTRPLVGKKVSAELLELVLVSVNSERFLLENDRNPSLLFVQTCLHIHKNSS